jgi:hypothetical protein
MSALTTQTYGNHKRKGKEKKQPKKLEQVIESQPKAKSKSLERGKSRSP